MRIRISRSWLARTARNSPVPFLYQTHTLTTSLPRATPPKPYSTSSASSGQIPEEDSSRERGKSTSTEADEDAPQPQPQPQLQRKSYLQRRAASIAHHDPPPPLQQRPRPQQRPRTGQRPNMTRSEKQVFSELLEQLGVSPEAPQSQIHAQTQTQSQSQTQTWGDNASGAGTKEASEPPSEADRSEMSQISAIFDSVLKDMKTRRTWTSDKPSLTSQKTPVDDSPDMEEMEVPPFERETSQSQEAHRQPSTYSNEDIPELLRTNELSVERAIELVVQRESQRIKAALREAVDNRTGDTGIWEVCKAQIFSMLQEQQQPTPTATSSTSTPPSPTLTIPDGVPRTSVIVSLYPQMLLVAFRLLNLHHPGSPLIAQFRATIKAQGRASAVLGSSTGLYNELIYFYWRGCLDLPGVVALLHEMEVTGVDADGRTVAQLEGIAHQRARDVREYRSRVRAGDATAPREPWWDLAPNRRAVKELFGPGGWMGRLEGRVMERRRRERMYARSS